RRLLAEGKPFLLPPYWLLLTSNLVREGIANPGGYRFADHLYRGVPSGRWGIGRAVDALLLRFPPAHSFRNRYRHARDTIVRYVRRHAGDDDAGRRPPIDVLSAPCGIARELVDAATVLRDTAPDALARVRWTGLDLDPAPLGLSAALAAERGLPGFSFRCADALEAASY